jgi:hypothetical protein
VATACTQGKRTKHGKPLGVVSDDQLEAREGQAGRWGGGEVRSTAEAERALPVLTDTLEKVSTKEM